MNKTFTSKLLITLWASCWHWTAKWNICFEVYFQKFDNSAEKPEFRGSAHFYSKHQVLRFGSKFCEPAESCAS